MKHSFKNSCMSLLILLALTFSALGVTPVLAAGPGAAWTYARSITLSTPTPSTNFQIRVQLTDLSNMAASGNDLRFYDTTDTPADYWIESWNTNPVGQATVWVEVPTAGTTSLTMYYGNVGASAASNGDNTFIAFDDFSGASINATKWDTKDANASISVSGGSVTLYAGPSDNLGDQLINKTAFAVSNGAVVETIMSSNVLGVCGGRGSISGATTLSGSGTYFSADEPVNSAFAAWSNGRDGVVGTAAMHDPGTGSTQYVITTSNSNWPANGNVISTAFETGRVEYFVNYVSQASSVTSTPSGTLYPVLSNFAGAGWSGCGGSNPAPFSVNVFRVRKFVSTYNPIVTVGAESPYASHTVTFNANGGLGSMSNQVASSSTALTANTFLRSGYAFNGWGTASGGPVVYADGATYDFSADTTLYAQWTPVSNALDFDGVNDYARIASPYTAFTNQITVEAWVYFDGGSDGIWMGQSGADVDNMATNVWLWHSGGTNMFTWYVNNGGSWLSLNLGAPSNGWHHVATVASNAGMQIYVDGVLNNSVASSLTNLQNVPAAIMDIGKDPRYAPVAGRTASQKIDEVRVWNVARTQPQIQANMNNLAAPQAGLVANYHFDQGVANGNNAGVTTALDDSGNSRNGTLNNFALTGSTSNWVNGVAVSAPDTTAPTVDSFAATSPSSSLNIPITAFTASDAVGVTGYLITESSTAPASGAAGWTGTAPATYTVGSNGSYTLYPWAKDAAGNVSSVYSSPASVTVCAPSTITVTSNADSGAGTLRQAVTDSCSGGTINFNPSLSGQTITLTSGNITLSNVVTIDGSALASQLTLSGNNTSNIFFVNTFNTATINNLTFINGQANYGGAIASNGNLTVNNSTFHNNTAVNYGGAIYSWTQTTTIVNGSTFYNNLANYGGALFSDGFASYGNQLYVTNSTFYNNSATTAGGAIHAGISFYGAPNTYVKNSTFSANSSSTGAGIMYQSGGLYVANSIIANSTGGGADIQGTPLSSINNLTGTVSLGALQNNGGPTQTMALPAGSPALTAGDAATCAAAPVNGVDQRGQARPQGGGNCDIGAYESNLLPGPGAFNKTAPTNAATTDINPTLSWGASSGQTDYEYCYDSTINSACDSTWTSTTNTTSAALSGLAYATQYEWQARAVSAGPTYTYANGGIWWTFTTIVAPPGAFSKATPASGTISQSTNLTMNWNASAGATSYEYCLDETADSTCTTSWQPLGNVLTVSQGALPANSVFYWQVRAINANSTSTEANGGTWWVYITDNTAPDATIDSQPNDPSASADASFTFSSTDGTATFECDLDGAGYVSCSSPMDYTGLSDGSHTFSVRATDTINNTGKAATYTWTINTYIASELLQNGGFNTYVGDAKTPKFWSSTHFTLSDGKNLKNHSEGTASVKMTGERIGATPVSKQLKQTLNLNGLAGDEFTFSFNEMGTNIPVAGLCRGQVLLYNGATLVSTETIDCATGTHGFTAHTLNFTASGDYTKVVIKFVYKKSSGAVWFDQVSLLR